MISLKKRLMGFMKDSLSNRFATKVIFFFITIFVIWFETHSQNMFGDYNEQDFLKMHTNKLTFIFTKIDTITGKYKTSTDIISRFNPKTKIISIIDLASDETNYFITDSFGELISVNKKGIIEDSLQVQKKPEIFFKNNYKIIKFDNAFRFYNSEKLLIRYLSDSTDNEIRQIYECCFFYSNNKLIKSSVRIFENQTMRNAVNPKEIFITTYDSNVEDMTYNKFQEKKLIETTNTITLKESKQIISKTYKGDKLVTIMKVVAK